MVYSLHPIENSFGGWSGNHKGAAAVGHADANQTVLDVLREIVPRSANQPHTGESQIVFTRIVGFPRCREPIGHWHHTIIARIEVGSDLDENLGLIPAEEGFESGFGDLGHFCSVR